MADPIIFPIFDQICSGQFTGFTLFGWQGILGVALMASVSILTIFYLLGVLSRENNTIAWVKLELYELFATALIIVLMAMLMNLYCEVNAGWFFTDDQLAAINEDTGAGITTDSSLFYMSGAYLKSETSRLSNYMVFTMGGYSLADVAASTKVMAKPVGQGFEASPLIGLGAPLKQVLNNAMIGILISYIITEAQYAILEYSTVAFPLLFLPLGIFFRSFLPTRRFGGTLIAISFSFLIIYPGLLTVTFYITEIGLDEVTTLYDNAGDAADFNTMVKKMNVVYASKTILDPSLSLNFIELVGIWFLNIAGDLFGFFYFKTLGIISRVALIGFIFPALNTLILVHAMRSLGRTLGEEIDITSLTRVI